MHSQDTGLLCTQKGFVRFTALGCISNLCIGYAGGSSTCTWLSSHSRMAAEGRERLLTKLLSACR